MSLPDERPSLDWLLRPIAKQQFFETYFEKQPLVVRRAQPAYYSSLLTLDEVDRVLTTLDRRHPDVVLKNAAREIDPEEYTVGEDTLDVARVLQLFAEGSTITLAFLDTVVPSLTRFCRALETEFSCSLQTNVYLTPPKAQGAKIHYDTHDVFVLQAAGSKQWTLYGSPVELPLPNQDYDPALHPSGSPTLEFTLEPGDLAYIPRGVMHDARSTDSVSLHVTAGILRYTWTDLLLEVVAAAALQDPAFRKSLPPGFAAPEFNRGPAHETLRDLLRRVAERPDFDAALDCFVADFLDSSPPILRGQLAQLSALDRLTLETRVGPRPGVIARLIESPGSLSIECYGRKITFPAHAREAVRFALGGKPFLIRDLPGPLDDPGKLTLVRRLIREGLLLTL